MNTSKKWIYDYDYMGRSVRVRRVTCTDDSPVAWDTTADIDRKFVWDDWLMLEELDNLQGGAGASPAFRGSISVPPVLCQNWWGLDSVGQNGAPQPGHPPADATAVGRAPG